MSQTPQMIDVGRAGLNRDLPSVGVPQMAGIVLLVVLIEVSLMPYIRILDGIPDLLAPAIVGIGLMRGVVPGAIAGFAGGLLIELTSPIGTLGVLALLYMAVGALSGRLCERPEGSGNLIPVALATIAAGAVQIGYASVQLLLGAELGPVAFVGSILLPTMILTALLSPPVLLLVRRALGRPRIVDPVVGT
jgi:rod shape-determining protein MreD